MSIPEKDLRINNWVPILRLIVQKMQIFDLLMLIPSVRVKENKDRESEYLNMLSGRLVKHYWQIFIWFVTLELRSWCDVTKFNICLLWRSGRFESLNLIGKCSFFNDLHPYNKLMYKVDADLSCAVAQNISFLAQVI